MQLRISFPDNPISISVLVCCASAACGHPPAPASSGGRTLAIFEASRPFDDAPLSEVDLASNSQPPSRPPSPAPPYHKVRVGDFRPKENAARILKQIQSRKEYRDAWILDSMVKP